MIKIDAAAKRLNSLGEGYFKMFEGNCQVVQRCFLIRLEHVLQVDTLDRFHEALGHAVALRDSY